MKPKKPKAPKPPNRKHNLGKFIVTKFIKKSEICWPRDIKLSMILSKDYPEFEFWEGLKFDIPIVSMAMMMTVKAKAYIDREYLKFKLVLPDKVEYKLEETKLGEDLPTVKPAKKSLLDFCRI